MLGAPLRVTAFISLVCLAFASLAEAEEPATVVLLQPEHPSAVARESTTRARAELGAAGFRVKVVTESGDDTRRSLEDAVSSAGAVAAIAIESRTDSTHAEVWVSDHVTGKLSIRPVETHRGGDTPALLAIRAVELLRASLVELRESERIKADAGPVSATVEHFTEPKHAATNPSPHHGFGLGLGVAGLFNFDAPAPAVAPVLRASYGTLAGWGGRITWMGPSAGAHMKGPVGTVTMNEELALAEAFVAPPLPRPFVLLASSGIGVYHVGASGQLNDPALAKSGGSTAFLLAIGGGGGLRMTDHFALELEGLAAISVPRIVIDMAGRTVGSLGRPLVGTSLGLFASF